MISNCQQKPTIQTPQRPKQTNQRQLNTCLLNSIKGKLSSTLANKKQQQQQSSLVNNCNKISTMSTLTQDMRTAVVPATTVNSPNSNVKPPLEAVVVNSIIYAKPSFCTIAVDLGDLTGNKKQQTQSLCPKDIFDSETFCSTSDMSLAASCLAGLIANTSASSSSSSSLHMGSDDAKVYRMCTTINGSIHHQISELCDNILAMAEMFKNHTNNKQDDDSFIEFNYGDDDDDDDYLYHQHKNDEEDEEDDEDDDDDEEDILDDQVYYDDDLDDDDNDVVDFSYECPIEPAPKLNCDKKKKVRFNTKPTVHVMHTWSYAYRAARKGEWEMYARDRERFKLRIQRVALTLNPILDREHRQKIYEKRFVNLYDNDDNNDNNNNVGPLTSETCQDNHNVTMANELVKETKELKNASDNANNTNNTNNNSESKKPHQKKKRKKRRFVKMGNKHYF